PTEGDRYVRQSLPLDAFRPMSERVSYRVAHKIEIISPLEQQALLPLTHYTVREMQPTARRLSHRAPDLPAAAVKPKTTPAPAEGWLQKLGKWFTPLFGRSEELPANSAR